MESDEQSMLFQWAKLSESRLPELRLLYHVPNGGSRNPIEAVNLKRQGVKSGVPDVCLPVARGIFHGLYIEMKFGKNKVSESQVQWLTDLSEQGYLTVVCYNFDAAKETIENYLTGYKT